MFSTIAAGHRRTGLLAADAQNVCRRLRVLEFAHDPGPLAGRVAGDYSNTGFNFFALNLTWKY